MQFSIKKDDHGKHAHTLWYLLSYSYCVYRSLFVCIQTKLNQMRKKCLENGILFQGLLVQEKNFKDWQAAEVKKCQSNLSQTRWLGKLWYSANKKQTGSMNVADYT